MRKPKRKLKTRDIRALVVQMIAIELLKDFELNPRDHDDDHVQEIAESIAAFGMNVPLLADDGNVLIAGHATLLACKLLGYKFVPVIKLAHMTEPEKVAFRIAHNRLCEAGKWSLKLLAANFELLYDADTEFDLSVTGFEIGEIDVARMGGKDAIKAAANAAATEAELVELPDVPAKPIGRLGDRFTIGRHVIACGDARDIGAYKLALGDDRADLGLWDGPYNVAIANNVSTTGRHGNFCMAAGEMSSAEFQGFVAETSKLAAAFSKPGAYNCMFTGWYSMTDMLVANLRVYPKLSHICIWSKTNGGLGQPWRNAWEGILVYRVPGGKIRNNVVLGKFGRNRTDVFTVAGVNTFRAGRMEELAAHPTCKPIQLLADLILDVTPIRGIVLDCFLGSGSSILAAEQSERRGVGLELDPRYVDVAIKRIEKTLNLPAIHQSGRTFSELAIARRDSNQGDF